MVIRVIVGICLGGAVGFLIGHFGRCASGGCPLTSNLYVSMIVGAVVGLLIAIA